MPEWKDEKDEPAILIGLRAIHAKVESIEEVVTKIKATMDAQDHEGRLRTVERRVFQMPTFSILISLVAVVVAIVRG